MNTARNRRTPGAWLPQILLMVSLALWAVAGHAQTDPPGRVGRLADLRGAVSWWDDQTGRWAEAGRNQPLTGGDRVSTAAGASAELRVGSTVLRLGETTELEVLRLDDERLAFQLHSGHLALRVRSREIAEELELVTAEARYAPLSAGHFRLDRLDDTTQATSWRGDLRIADPAGFVITTGQRVELYRERRSNALHFQIGVPVNDRYAEAMQREDQRLGQEGGRSVSARYVSPEMTGVEDLDRDGRWEQHPEFGAVWLPQTVAANWAPYSDGRWAWVQPWGWTWVDNARWGFAPFHYGRWAYWRNAWCWVPGAYVARPVYAPALVAWVGGDRWDFRLNAGGPSVGWLPLAPREVYAPHYVVTPRYRERVNPTPAYRWQHEPGRPPAGPVVYGNQGVPHAVTVVPRDSWLQRQPVRRGDAEARDNRDNRDNRDGRIERDGRAVRDERARVHLEPQAPVAAPLPPPGMAYGPRRPDRLPDTRLPEIRLPDSRPPPPVQPQPQAQPAQPQPQPQPFGPPAPRAQVAPQPQPQPQPAPVVVQPVAPVAPVAPPAAVPRPVIEKPRDAERERGRERERERRPAGAEGGRPLRENENQK